MLLTTALSSIQQLLLIPTEATPPPLLDVRDASA